MSHDGRHMIAVALVIGRSTVPFEVLAYSTCPPPLVPREAWSRAGRGFTEPRSLVRRRAEPGRGARPGADGAGRLAVDACLVPRVGAVRAARRSDEPTPEPAEGAPRRSRGAALHPRQLDHAPPRHGHDQLLQLRRSSRSSSSSRRRGRRLEPRGARAHARPAPSGRDRGARTARLSPAGSARAGVRDRRSFPGAAAARAARPRARSVSSPASSWLSSARVGVMILDISGSAIFSG